MRAAAAENRPEKGEAVSWHRARHGKPDERQPGRHRHSWMVIRRTKHGDRILVEEQCSLCGIVKEHWEHT
jgi:hypothetical protein